MAHLGAAIGRRHRADASAHAPHDGRVGTDAERWARMNEPLIERFRASGGHPPRQRTPLLLLTTTGSRTGLPRVTPLNYTLDGDRIVVIASKGGAPRHPAWYTNLVANPVVTIELGPDTFRARATTALEPERTRLYDAHVKVMPFFDGFRKRVRGREIPVVILDRLD
jgi:deazaflavin-dependent oxidoreductase (nitroreductase family)